jgi:hypothetical protein
MGLQLGSDMRGEAVAIHRERAPCGNAVGVSRPQHE